jgi:hypothetical protein
MFVLKNKNRTRTFLFLRTKKMEVFMPRQESLVSIETVKAAMERLTAAGKSITIRAIQAEIGGGSVSNIHMHLQKIKAEAGPEIPLETDETFKPILNSSREVFKAAVDSATKEHAEKIKSLTLDIETISFDLNKSEEKRHALEEELTKAQRLVAYWDQFSTEKNDQVKKLEADLTKINQELGEAKALASREREVADKTAEKLAAVEKELTDTKIKLATVENTRKVSKDLFEQVQDVLEPMKPFLIDHVGELRVIVEELHEIIRKATGHKAKA